MILASWTAWGKELHFLSFLIWNVFTNRSPVMLYTEELRHHRRKRQDRMITGNRFQGGSDQWSGTRRWRSNPSCSYISLATFNEDDMSLCVFNQASPPCRPSASFPVHRILNLCQVPASNHPLYSRCPSLCLASPPSRLPSRQLLKWATSSVFVRLNQPVSI